MDASSHGGLDKGTNILVLDGTFVFSESALFVSVNSRNILKIAFSALIADWAIERMISEEEFHDTTSSYSGLLRLGDNLHVRSNLSSARGNRLGDTLDLNQAHSAVTSDRESLVIAESGNFNTTLCASLINSIRAINFNRLIVNIDVECVISSSRGHEV